MSLSSFSRIPFLLLLLLLLGSMASFFQWPIVRRPQSSSSTSAKHSSHDQQDVRTLPITDGTLNVAFLGNSILYYNDCPRLLARMLRIGLNNADEDSSQHAVDIYQNSCLRGGASLPGLWRHGNGMHSKFGGDRGNDDVGAPMVVDLVMERKWHYIVLNDQTQAPARPESRHATIEALKEHYVPRIQKQRSNNASTPIVIFLQTTAYEQEGLRSTEDLGDFAQFTSLLEQGYQEYCLFVKKHGISCRVAPVGNAALWLRNHNPQLWHALYSWDHYHPSPHGTYLEASVLYCTMVGRAPPALYDVTWWEEARYMQPPDQEPLPRPTAAEARELRKVACLVCNVEWEEEGDVPHASTVPPDNARL